MNQQHDSHASLVSLDEETTTENRSGTSEHPLLDKFEESKNSREEESRPQTKRKKDSKHTDELEEDEVDVVNEIDTFLIEDDDL